MKIRMVCDCCDSVFKEMEIPDDAGMTDLEALTGEEFKDIIRQDDDESDVVVSMTCDECNEDLALDDDDFAIPAKPLIH